MDFNNFADAEKTAKALDALAEQSNASFAGLLALFSVLKAKDAITDDEAKDVADVMAGLIASGRQYEFETAIRQTLPRYRTPKRKQWAAQGVGGVVFPEDEDTM